DRSAGRDPAGAGRLALGPGADGRDLVPDRRRHGDLAGGVRAGIAPQAAGPGQHREPGGRPVDRLRDPRARALRPCSRARPERDLGGVDAHAPDPAGHHHRVPGGDPCGPELDPVGRVRAGRDAVADGPGPGPAARAPGDPDRYDPGALPGRGRGGTAAPGRRRRVRALRAGAVDGFVYRAPDPDLQLDLAPTAGVPRPGRGREPGPPRGPAHAERRGGRAPQPIHEEAVTMVESTLRAGSTSRAPEPPAAEPVLEARDLFVYYGESPAIRGVSIRIPERRVVAFIGPSGCGKSTLLRCFNRMNDLIPGTRIAGAVRYRGEDLYAPDVDPVEVRRRIGMVFQQPNPFPKSIYDNVAFGPRINGYRGDMAALVERSLRQAALWEEVRDRLHDSALALSGGQQQRL